MTLDQISKPLYFATEDGPRPRPCPHCKGYGFRKMLYPNRVGYKTWCILCGYRGGALPKKPATTDAMMMVGFLGGSAGLSQDQSTSLRSWLSSFQVGIIGLHHGLGTQSDVEANGIARSLGIKTYGHPSTEGRSNEPVHALYAPQESLLRVYQIVDAIEVLLAAPPPDMEWEFDAGLRYAEQQYRQVVTL